MEILLLVFGCFVVYFLFFRKKHGGYSHNTTQRRGGHGHRTTQRLDQFKVRLKSTSDVSWSNGDDSGPIARTIECKGLFPSGVTGNVAFQISIFDKTLEKRFPVMSMLEDFQEPFTRAFQSNVEMGSIAPNMGLLDWAPVGGFFPDFLQPPYGGDRILVAVCRFIDVDEPPDVHLGYNHSHDEGVLWQTTLLFHHYFPEKGYIEITDNRDEAKALSVKVAIAVAMADGALDGSEGLTIQTWIKRDISAYDNERQQELKAIYNDAMREAYREAKRGTLNLDEITARLNEVGEVSTKYEAMELCFDVMAADGVADRSELKIIRTVADALELNLDEIEKMKDQKILELDVNLSPEASIDELLGIDPSLSTEERKRILRGEFKKWNDRLNVLPEGAERENAQRMLDRISEARASGR